MEEWEFWLVYVERGVKEKWKGNENEWEMNEKWKGNEWEMKGNGNEKETKWSLTI